MQSLFNYTTIAASLEKSTRTLHVRLNRPNQGNSINLEMLFELESLLSWVSTRVEVYSIFFDSTSDYFSVGYNVDKLSKQSQNQITKVTEKLQKIVQALIHLPQTVVFDLGNGAQNLAAELALGADIRIASNKTQIQFNHSNLGLTASSCGLSVLTLLVGQMHARNWILGGKEIAHEKLENSGFLFESYDSHSKSNIIHEVLTSIYKQAPVQRIQSKFGLLEMLNGHLDQAMEAERRISKASLMSQDWKTINKSNEEEVEGSEDTFMGSKEMSYAVKLSLVKDGQTDHVDLPN